MLRTSFSFPLPGTPSAPLCPGNHHCAKRRMRSSLSGMTRSWKETTTGHGGCVTKRLTTGISLGVHPSQPVVHALIHFVRRVRGSGPGGRQSSGGSPLHRGTPSCMMQPNGHPRLGVALLSTVLPHRPEGHQRLSYEMRSILKSGDALTRWIDGIKGTAKLEHLALRLFALRRNLNIVQSGESPVILVAPGAMNISNADLQAKDLLRRTTVAMALCDRHYEAIRPGKVDFQDVSSDLMKKAVRATLNPWTWISA